MRKLVNGLFLSVCLMATPALALDTQKYVGGWNGPKAKNIPTSIQFVEKRVLEYCFKKNCWTYKVTGNPMRTFRMGTKTGAKWVFVRQPDGSVIGVFTNVGGVEYKAHFKVK